MKPDDHLLALSFYARANTGNYWDILYWNERRKIGSLPTLLNAISLSGSDLRRLLQYLEDDRSIEELETEFQLQLPAVYAERDKQLAKTAREYSSKREAPVSLKGLDLGKLEFKL